MKKYYFLLIIACLLWIGAFSQTPSNQFNVETFPFKGKTMEQENNNGGKHSPPDFSKKVYTAQNPSRDVINILVLEEGLDGTMIYHYDNALNSLGYSRTLVTTWSEFDSEFNTYGWDLVIINSYEYPLSTAILDGINNFVLSGGKLIFSSWNVSSYSSHTLLSTMGITYVSDISNPMDFWCYYCSNGVFNNPNSVYEFWATDDQYSVDGQIVNVNSGATQLAYYLDYSTSGAVVLNESSNCIFNAFQSVNFNIDFDSDGKYDIQELIENEITLIASGCNTAQHYGNVNDPEVYGSTTYTGEEHWYKFYASGIIQNVSVSLCDSDFDTYLYVYDECGGEALAANDDYNCLTKKPIDIKAGKDSRSLQSQLDFSHLYSGWYYVKIRGFGGNFGNYTLSVHTSDDLCLNAYNYGNVGDPSVTGSIYELGARWYYFDVPVDINDVSVSLCGSDYDTWLEVYDECGASYIDYNDDYDCDTKHPLDSKDGRSLQSQIDFPLLAAGTYYVKVRAYSHNFGNFILTIDQGNGLNPPTDLTANLDETNGEVELSWDYEPSAGEGFYEDFEDGVADNWIPITGSWSVSGGNYNVSSDPVYLSNTSYYNQDFMDYQFETTLRKSVGESCNIGIWFNGIPQITGYGSWLYGYKLVYCSDGDWNLVRFDNGASTFLQDWISSSDLNIGIGAWNTISIYSVNGYIEIYFNGNYQNTYFDDTYLSGKVGVQMYDNINTGSAAFDNVSLAPLTKDYTFGEVRQNSIRNICSGGSADCMNCGKTMTLIGTEQAPVPIYGSQYTYNPDDNRAFQYFIIYRNGSVLDATAETTYFDYLPSYGTYNYEVSAYYSEGESYRAGPVAVSWEGIPDISVNPTIFNEELESGQTSTQNLTITNEGEGDLFWQLMKEATSDSPKTSKLYEQYKHLTSYTEGGDENNVGKGKVAPIPIDVIENQKGTVEILAWVTYTDMDEEYVNTLNAISQYFTDYNITTSTETDVAELAVELAGKDVFLIPEQEGGSTDYFVTLGLNWSSFLDIFVQAGGKIIVCGSEPGYNAYEIINSAGLFDMSYYLFDEGQTMSVIEPSHFIMQGVPSTITAMNATVFMDITDSQSVNLVEWDGHQSVAAKNIGTGAIVYIGYDYYDYDDNAALIIANAIQYQGTSGWLNFNQTSGNISSGFFETVEVTFDATVLMPDIYTANINIFSTDPDEPYIVVPVTLTVTDIQPLDAEFTAEPLTGIAPLTVIFTDLSTSNVQAWEWDFDNDGFIDSYLQNPSWDYNDPGLYDVKLTVYDGTKATDFELKTEYISVISGTNYYELVWTSPYNPMTFYILEATIDEMPLQAGDEVGLFDIDPITGEEICVGAGLLVEELVGGVYLEMIASMDDGSNPAQANGFTPGNSIIYKLYNAEAGEITTITASYPYPGYDEVYTSQGSAFVELNGVTSIEQCINLATGWNLMSFRAIPENPNMLEVVQPLIDDELLVKVLDETGGSIFHLPFPPPNGQWSNTIGDMQVTEGYYVKVDANGTLCIEGQPVETPLAIPLTTGWNIIGYPCAFAQNALAAVQDLIDDEVLVKVIDEAGGTIFHLPFPPPNGQWSNTIGDFESGKGYYLKVSENTTLTIDCPADFEETSSNNPAIIETNYFVPVYQNNPFMPMHIALAPNEVLEVGDEVGIFDGDVCVGAAVINANNETVIITCSQHDPASEIIDGFSAGNPISIKVWKKQSGDVFDVEFTLLEGAVVFAPLETMIGEIESLITGISTFDGRLSYSIHPNPFAQKTTLMFSLKESQDLGISIRNLNGSTVLEIPGQTFTKGEHAIEIDLQDLEKGIYFMTIQSNSGANSTMQKLIKM